MEKMTLLFYTADRSEKESLSSVLSRDEIDLIAVKDLEDIPAILRTHDCDIILCDMTENAAAIERLIGLLPEKAFRDKPVPILIIGEPGEDEIIRLSRALPVDFMFPPFRSQELLMRLSSLHQRGRMDQRLISTVKSLEDEKMLMLEELEKRDRGFSQDILFQELLFDKITGFPTTPTLMADIREILERKRPIDVIYFSISKLGKVEEVFGWEVIDNVLEFIAKQLEEIAKRTLTDQDIMAIDRAAGDDFILFISSPENYYRSKAMPLREFGERLIARLKESIHEKFGADIAFQFEFYLGLSTIEYNAKVRLERLVYTAIKNAVSYAISQEQRDQQQNFERLNQIIIREEITTLFQPIVDMKTLTIIGVEAISRGMTDDFFHQPQLLFDLAERAELVWRLERVCRNHALKRAITLPQDMMLFLNLDPTAANDPDLLRTELLRESPFQTSRIVLEITERTHIDNFHRFKKHINALKKSGFSIAIDDAGSGYASLQSITEIEPHFIKFDMTLVRDINSTIIKQTLVEVLVRFARKMNIPVIAEGIETPEEYAALMKLNVPLGQGYLFARPCKSIEECLAGVDTFREQVKRYGY